MSNRFVGVGRSRVKTARVLAPGGEHPVNSGAAPPDASLKGTDGDPPVLKLTDGGLIDGTEPENSWLVPGVRYWLVVLSRDAIVGVRLTPSLHPGGRFWCSTPTPREIALWIGKTEPRLLPESPLRLEVAHAKVG